MNDLVAENDMDKIILRIIDMKKTLTEEKKPRDYLKILKTLYKAKEVILLKRFLEPPSVAMNIQGPLKKAVDKLNARPQTSKSLTSFVPRENPLNKMRSLNRSQRDEAKVMIPSQIKQNNSCHQCKKNKRNYELAFCTNVNYKVSCNV